MIYYRVFFTFLLLNGGLLKKIIFVPIDLTLLSFFALLPSLFFKKVSVSKLSLKLVLSYLPFFFFFCFTSTYTISTEYYQIKLLKYSASLVSLIITFFVFDEKGSLAIFKKLYLLTFLVVAPIVIYTYLNNTLEFYFMSDGALVDYLALSSFTAIFFILYIENNNLLINILKFIALIIMIFMGGRGPIISLLIIIIIYYFISSKLKNLKFSNIILFLSFTISLSVFIYKTEIANNLITRFNMIYSGFDDQNVNKRIILWADAVKGINESPIFGHGIGSFSKYSRNVDKRGYPHNIFLEILFESGFIGLLLFSIFFIYVSKLIFNNNEHIFLIFCLAFTFLEAQKSGSLEESRILIMWVGIICTYIIKNPVKLNENKIIYEKA